MKRLLAGIGLVAIVGGLLWVFLLRADDDPPTPLTVTWNESVGRPACRYDEAGRRVEVRLRIDGDAGKHDRVVATVTAYADENTSVPVGSSSRTVMVEGTVHQKLELSIAVSRPPHVGEDDVAACKLAVRY